MKKVGILAIIACLVLLVGTASALVLSDLFENHQTGSEAVFVDEPVSPGEALLTGPDLDLDLCSNAISIGVLRSMAQNTLVQNLLQKTSYVRRRFSPQQQDAIANYVLMTTLEKIKSVDVSVDVSGIKTQVENDLVNAGLGKEDADPIATEFNSKLQEMFKAAKAEALALQRSGSELNEEQEMVLKALSAEEWLY